MEKICARCSKTQRNHPELSFHAFPDPETDRTRFRKWVSGLKKVRADWKHPYEEGKSKYSIKACVICSAHFSDDQFLVKKSATARAVLQSYAVPNYRLDTTEDEEPPTTSRSNRNVSIPYFNSFITLIFSHFYLQL